MTTPYEGVNHDDTESGAIESLLNRWKDAEKPSDQGDGNRTPEHDEDEDVRNAGGDNEDDDDDLIEDEDDDSSDDSDDTDQSDEDGEDGEDSDNEDGEGHEATDDHKVKITVDGETKTVTVKELKRLFGQEASLTRKSQEVAAQRKVAEQEVERYLLASQKLIDKAQQRFAPFANIDWMVAQQRLNPDEFSSLRNEARDAHAELTFLTNEADAVLNNVKEAHQSRQVEAARAAITVLEKDIPGWNRELYDRIRTFAVGNGMDTNTVNSIVDPAALKLLHNAMKYSDMKQKAAAKKATAPKAAPKKVVKPAKNSPGKMGNSDKAGSAKAQLKKTGNTEDAVAALLAGWQKSGS